MTTKQQFIVVMDAGFKWLAREVGAAIANPKTTGAGVGLLATAYHEKDIAKKIELCLAGVGLIFCHDGTTGSTKPNQEVNKAVEQVQELRLPAPEK